MRGLTFSASLLTTILVCSSGVFSEEPSHAPFGVEYAFPDTEVAIVLEPAKIWADPVLRTLPLEVIETMVRRETGFAVEDVDLLLLFVAPAHEEEDTGRLGFVLKMSRPMVWDEVFSEGKAGKIQRLKTPDELKGQPWSACSIVFHAYAIDETTLVMGSPNALPEMFENSRQTPVDTELTKQLRAQPLNSAAMVHFSPSGFQNGLQELWQQGDFFDALSPLHKETDLLEHARLKVDLATGATLDLTCPSEGAAERLTQLLDTTLDAMVQAFDPSDISTDDPHSQPLALLRYQWRIAKSLRRSVDLSQRGQHVTLTTVGQSHTPEQLVLTGVVAAQSRAPRELREQIDRDGSVGRLRKIGRAIHNYYDTFDQFPPALKPDQPRSRLSWRVHILPFIDEAALYDQFKLDEPWDSEHNLRLIDRIPTPYVSPASPELAEEGKTRYQRPRGEGLPMSVEGQLRLKDITDGTTKTIMAVETPFEQAVVWTQPDDFEVDLDNPISTITNSLVESFNALLYDGSVHVISNNVDNENLKGLLTHAGSEVVQAP